MSRLIGPKELRRAVEKETFLKNGTSACVEGIKYDFRFNGVFLKAQHGKEAHVDDYKGTADNESISIRPGETVFLLTTETLDLPHNIKAELSHKRKIAHLGLLLLGGFCVDPRYKGPLVFGVYNFSAKKFTLDAGRKLIAAQFYELSAEEYEGLDEEERPDALNGFPDDVHLILPHLEGISNDALKSLGI